jgi:hypothetical protein
MSEPIWEQVSKNIEVIQDSAFKRGQITARIEIAKQLRAQTKKPPMWLSKFIADLERAER